MIEFDREADGWLCFRRRIRREKVFRDAIAGLIFDVGERRKDGGDDLIERVSVVFTHFERAHDGDDSVFGQGDHGQHAGAAAREDDRARNGQQIEHGER